MKPLGIRYLSQKQPSSMPSKLDEEDFKGETQHLESFENSVAVVERDDLTDVREDSVTTKTCLAILGL